MTDCIRRRRGWRWLGLIYLLLPSAAFAGAIRGVGFSEIEVPEPVNGGTMPGLVFYPSATAKTVSEIGSYDLNASSIAPATPGAG